MPATAEQSALAADPTTDAQTLADLAWAAPDLWPVIATHPNVYPGLVDWMRQNGALEGATAGSGTARIEVPAPDRPDEVAVPGPGIRGPRVWTAVARLSRRTQVLSGAAVLAAIVAVTLIVTLVVVPRQAASSAAADARKAHDSASADFTTAAAACGSADAALSDAQERARSAATTDASTLKDPTVLDALTAAVATAGGVTTCVAPAMASDSATIQRQARDMEAAAGTVRGAADALLVAVAAVVGGVQAKKDEAAAAATASAEATQQAEASAAAAARTWHFRSNDGYTFDLELRVGSSVTEDTFIYAPPGQDGCSSDPLPGTDQVKCETAKLADVCTDFDPSTMVAIPVTATVTATTTAFDTSVAARFALGTTGEYGGPDQTGAGQVEVATVYSGQGPTCTGPTGSGLPSLGVTWNTPMKTGATSTFRFDVILQKWRTPAAPTGDSALLDFLTVAPEGSTPNGTTTTYSSDGRKVLTLGGKPVGD